MSLFVERRRMGPFDGKFVTTLPFRLWLPLSNCGGHHERNQQLLRATVIQHGVSPCWFSPTPRG
jgi:hypothetical protein